MQRAEPNQGKMLPNVETEPNFYEMPPLPSFPEYAPPMDYRAGYHAPAYPNAGHPASWPPTNAPYTNHYPGYGAPPASFPPPPRDQYAYPNQTYPAYSPHGHDYPPQYHGGYNTGPTYGQPSVGYADSDDYNIYKGGAYGEGPYIHNMHSSRTYGEPTVTFHSVTPP